MENRRTRIVLGVALAISLVLPWNRLSDPAGVWPTALFIVYAALHFLGSLIAGGRGVDLSAYAVAIGSVLAYLAVPLLSLANLTLARGPRRDLLGAYRVLLFTVIPLSWWRAARTDPALQGIGFWANLGLIGIAGLLEVLRMIRDRRR